MEPRNARTAHQREEGQALYLLAPSSFLSLMGQNLPHRIFFGPHFQIAIFGPSSHPGRKSEPPQAQQLIGGVGDG